MGVWAKLAPDRLSRYWARAYSDAMTASETLAVGASDDEIRRIANSMHAIIDTWVTNVHLVAGRA